MQILIHQSNNEKPKKSQITEEIDIETNVTNVTKRYENTNMFKFTFKKHVFVAILNKYINKSEAVFAIVYTKAVFKFLYFILYINLVNILIRMT